MPYGRTGITNLGNTCYMNASLQCLSHTVNLTKHFITENFKNNQDESYKDLNDEFHSILRNLWGNNKSINISNFKMLISKHIPFVKGNNQHDAHEFIINFLEKLHESMKHNKDFNITGEIINTSDKLIYDSCEHYINTFSKNYSKIVELFYGQIHSIILIPELEYQSYKFQAFPILELPIEDCNNISECFDKYTTIEHDVNYNLEEQNYNTKHASKKMSLWKLPKILIIQLIRFLPTGEKINSHIDFPVNKLDLSKYCLDVRSKKNTYSLYGVVNHYGCTGGGHYTAYCKNNGDWYEFNDAIVSKVENIITNNAYILFYKKI